MIRFDFEYGMYFSFYCLSVSACVDSLLTICGFHLYFPFFMNIIIKNETLNS